MFRRVGVDVFEGVGVGVFARVAVDVSTDVARGVGVPVVSPLGEELPDVDGAVRLGVGVEVAGRVGVCV